MSEDAPTQFACDQCGRLFHISPHLAGKRVRCPCGHELMCPEPPPFDPDHVEFSVAPPDPSSPAPAAAVRRAKPVQHVEVRRVLPEGQRRKSLEPGTIRDVQMPLALLAGGLAIDLIAAAINKAGFVPTVLSGGRDLAMQIVLMVIVIFITAKLRHFSLGRPGIAVFKVTSVCVAAPAILLLLSPIFQIVCLGGVLSLIVGLALYYCLLGALFDLEERDSFDCIAAIFFTYAAVFTVQRLILKP